MYSVDPWRGHLPQLPDLVRLSALGSVARAPLDVGGGGREGSLVKALLKVPHAQLQPTQINHRVSVVLPGEGQTFCGVEGVRRWCPGHRPSVRVGCDAAHDTTPQSVLNCWATLAPMHDA